MWYNADYPATWAVLNTFLGDVLSLFSGTFNAIMSQPIMVLFLSAQLLAVAYGLFRLLGRASKK